MLLFYESLWVGRAALGLTLLGFMILNWLGGGLIGVIYMFLGNVNEDAMNIFLTLLAFGLLALAAVLHPLIGRRLTKLAAA